MTVKKSRKIINIIVATILVLIRRYVITFVMFVFVIPIIHYHWYDVDELRQFVSDEKKNVINLFLLDCIRLVLLTQ